MKHLYPYLLESVRTRIFRKVWSVLILCSAFLSIHAQSLVPELVFMNPKLKTGAGCSAEGKDGAVYIFSNVGAGVDALVTIQGRSGSQVTLSTADLKGPDQDAVNGTGYDNAWQPKVCYGNGNAPEHTSWWMEFKVSFVKHNNPAQPVSVNQFFVSGFDIDGDDDHLHEFQSYYKMQYFTLEQNTVMTTSSIKGCLSDGQMDGKRFDGTAKNYAGVTTTATDVMVSNFYSNTSSLIVRVGAETGSTGSIAADRMYSLWFKSLTYDVPVSTPLPLTLVAFNAQLGSGNQDVKVNWTTTMEQNTSHFTLQRSLDGKEYHDDAVILTDGNSEIRKDYHYTDHLPQAAGSLVYYRLKMVDLDAKFKYSDVIVVRVQQDKQEQLMIYPNPVAKELRVTIPSSWQSKTIAYHLYSSNGVLMKQQISENAGQTETLHVEDLPAGIYIIQTVNGKQTATQKFIKTNS
jgi:hypothetical protein